jgi:hypothetical protein
VLGRAAAAAWRAGDLRIAPEAVRQMFTGPGGGVMWFLAAGFLVGMEEAAGALAGAGGQR